MKLRFLGAAGNVTGSRHLLEADGCRLLVDCGLYQERDHQARNWEPFPVPPKSINAVLLTHAHLDHCGLLPKLVKDGFTGRIYCTPATAEIAKIILLDSAKLMEEDTEHKLKRHKKENRIGPYPVVPLYTTADAETSFSSFEPVQYKQPIELGHGIEATLYDAGHVLGSSIIKVKINKNTDTGKYIAVFFNTQDKLLGEKNIRQALSYAINKDALGEARALSPISKDSWAYNSQVKPYLYDRDKAKDMIDDFKKNFKDDLVVNLTTSPILLLQAESITKDWEAIGVKVNLQVISTLPNDYQALLAIFDVPEDPDQYSIWHSTQTSTNITKYQNARIDKLLEDGRNELDLEARRKIYLDFQRFLVEDSPAAFLYYPTTYTIKRK